MEALRKLILTFVINAGAVAITTTLLPGMSYSGGLQGITVITLVLAGVNILIKPFLSLLALPVEIATIALLTVATNAILLIILSQTIVGFSLFPFPFPGIFSGPFLISPFTLPPFGTAVLGAVVIGLLVSVLYWLTAMGGKKRHH